MGGLPVPFFEVHPQCGVPKVSPAKRIGQVKPNMAQAEIFRMQCKIW